MGATGLLLLSLVLAGCEPAPQGDPRPCPGDVVALEDANNYGLVGALEIARTEVAAGRDVTVSFATLTHDLLGRDLDVRTDVRAAALVHFPASTPDEVRDGLAENRLLQSDVGLYMAVETMGATSVQLSDFQFLENYFDVEGDLVEGPGTWLLTLNAGLDAGQDVRQLGFLVPTEADTNSAVDLATASANLTLDVTLTTLVPTVFPPPGSPVTLDLAGLGADGLGGAFDPRDVEEVWLAHFPDRDLPSLEGDFLRLEETAETLYTQPHDGASTVALTNLVDADGAPFSGVNDVGTWLLALQCTSCTHPAPPVLTVVVPCAE